MNRNFACSKRLGRQIDHVLPSARNASSSAAPSSTYEHFLYHFHPSPIREKLPAHPNNGKTSPRSSISEMRRMEKSSESFCVTAPRSERDENVKARHTLKTHILHPSALRCFVKIISHSSLRSPFSVCAETGEDGSINCSRRKNSIKS
jgi:hypothetical protein